MQKCSHAPFVLAQDGMNCRILVPVQSDQRWQHRMLGSPVDNDVYKQLNVLQQQFAEVATGELCDLLLWGKWENICYLRVVRMDGQFLLWHFLLILFFFN